MKKDFLKILCSIPVILIFLYFMPFLGVCLLLIRGFVYPNKKKIAISSILIIVGVILLIPKGLNSIFDMMKFNFSNIPYFNDIVTSSLYNNNIIKYSKLLITIGTIFLILSFIFKNLIDKIKNSLKKYISNQQKMDYEIKQKNSLIMEEKREKAKNTHVVHCPSCGASNMLTEATGICKYCRKPIK